MDRKLTYLSIFMSLFLLVVTAKNAIADAGWYGGISGGYLFHEGDEEYKGSQLYEGIIGHDFNTRWSLEGGVGILTNLEKREFGDGRWSPEHDATGVDLRATVLYHLTENALGWDPYVDVTGGWDIYNRGTGHGGSGDPFAGVGFGTFYNFRNNMFLRAGYNFEPAVETGKIHQNLLATLGWRWGQGRARRLGLAGDMAGYEPLGRVYFAFDSAKLDQRAKDTLQANAKWMKENATKKAVVEGHCDERGTSEYNLVLGQHRAESAYQYLRGLGVDAKRMTTISYGKERPADAGHNEAAWAKNRRAQFAVSEAK